ncbi:peroxide stress protein YaaA [Salinibacterium sp. NSLL150]|uniref:YaaA family protein n=1 Tax=unclassified Salinibacterium TaxID=2632331 RepID=UPI0018CFA06C|nr:MULTISPECIES: peroxide stress protein YaaA [unclassified Salinibacterium]MBH0100184.1 peroxide stress protein YaaA [Salinibacterium sp. NSLL35]MBH0102938.1 peroxide stress protein YaaA [Salinibacterium sp. NSLL150]MBH0105698.1 peroxide stress protein YaaA [Salinibacterium sp. NSLL16]MBH0108458.1 peroxide stress protein YaaA [Salinibacterium sp. NSLL17]
MIILLPPSETKRDGGDDNAALDYGQLSFPELTEERQAVSNALIELSGDPDAAQSALGISTKQLFEVERNRTLAVAPVMPALKRYTGVLFDGLDAASLTPEEWAFAEKCVVVHSALFGPIGAGDPIPAYRLSHNSKVPGVPLKRHWRASVTAALAAVEGLQLDFRSEAYAQLGATSLRSVYLRVVTEGADGKRVALSHFNKKSKGLFARALIRAGIDHESIDSLLTWANGAGFRLEPGAPGELDLVVENA